MKRRQKNRYVRKSIMTVLTFVLSFILQLKISGSEFTPDFAFPKKVEQKSDSILSVALEHENDIEALRAVMDICIARNLLLDSDSQRLNIDLLDAVAERLKIIYRPIAYLLEAEIIGTTEPEKIYSLVDSATLNISNYPHISIDEISSLLENNKIKNFSVGDFILLKSVGFLSAISSDNRDAVIPFYPVEKRFENSIGNRARNKALQLLQFLIDKSKNDGNNILTAIGEIEYSRFIDNTQRANYLLDKAKELKGEEGEGLLLFELWKTGNPTSGIDQNILYANILDWLHRYPSGFMAESLEYAESQMSRQSMTVDLPRYILPHSKIIGKLSSTNVDKGYILIYKLKESQTDRNDGVKLNKLNGLKPIQIIDVTSEGKVPFSMDREFEISGLSEGLYVAVPSMTSKLSHVDLKANSNSFYSTFRVTDLSIVTSTDIREKNSGRIYVVKATNQQPVENAVVKLYEGSAINPKYTLKTKADGSVDLPEGYYRIEASYGNSIIKTESANTYIPSRINTTYHVSILTDLSVYRPSDTIEFAVVGWSEYDRHKTLISDSIVKLTLRDVNFSEVGSTCVRLDSEGRASGKITIPSGHLLGSYSLIAEYESSPGNMAGIAEIEVAEYKLPAFSVSLENLGNIQTDNFSELKFKGYASTYSGMPISNASVSIKVEYLPFYGMLGDYRAASYTTDLTTTPEGEFELVLPTNGLRGTIYEQGRYRILARVTSESGDSEESAPLFFYLGKNTTLRPSISQKTMVHGDSIRFFVPAYDMAGIPQQVEVNYSIINLQDSKEIVSGSFKTPDLVIPSDRIESGKYMIKVNLPGSSSYETAETVIYRDKQPVVPYETSLWVPKTQYVYSHEDKSVDISFGSIWPDSYIMMTVSGTDGAISREWIKVDSCMKTISIDIPTNREEVFVDLCAMHDFASVTERINIIPASNLERMEVSSLTFRENITAGSQEQWRFRFNIQNRVVADLPVLAVMTDKALNALKDFKWSLNLPSFTPFSSARLRPLYYGNSVSYKNFSITKGKYIELNSVQSWQTYGYPLISGRYNVMPLYRVSARGESESPMLANKSMQKVMTTDLMVEESASDDSEGMADSNSEETLTDETPVVRPVELPVAFFKSDLFTDEDGILTLDFTVPDFNTTWQLQLLGYDKDLLNAGLIVDAISSKPVMVKANLPQFLRTGDKAVISATIYNNSDQKRNIGGKIVITDPSDGNVIVEKDFSPVEINSTGSSIISCDLNIKDNLSLISVSVYAYTDNHTDGERGFIPIFPSSTPVIDSKTFYLDGSESSFTMSIPEFKKEDNVTLKYCDNPSWEVLLSLPVLTENVGKNVVSISKSLFATIIGKELADNNTQIKEGLKAILNSEDSTLSQSRLLTDASLKNVDIAMTPWVNNAASETSRIRSLEYLLNPEKTDLILSDMEEKLEKFQNGDGGFSWIEGKSSSPFITSEVLAILGRLNRLGLITENLNKVANSAIKYYDRCLEEMYAKGLDPGPLFVVNYLYDRSYFENKKSQKFKIIESQNIGKALQDWRHWTIADKSKLAVVLWHSKEYRQEVETIVASLEEFVGSRYSLQELALMLETFTIVSPGCSAFQRVKKLLLLKKETENWGDNPYNAGIIYSILSSEPKSSFENRMPEISINGEPLEINATQSLTGSYTINLDTSRVSGKQLEIHRRGDMPAWGGIISQKIMPVKDVKASSVENLSIEKTVQVINGDGIAKPSSQFKKGDKVKITISLNCGKDMDYVTVIDQRAACLKPDNFISGNDWSGRLQMYREVRSDRTSYYIENLPKGKHTITYECIVEREGEYSLGIVSAQSLYSPIESAHSSGSVLKVISQD